ncbi:MAG: DMT family transporter [Pelagibacteraceae bacterium]|nr:DMT family transporter [Pelagibacteraceae bacterium]
MNKFLDIFLGFAGYTIFVFLDSIIKKYLVQHYPVLEINFYICLFSLIPISIALQFISGWHVLINNKVHIQLFRGFLGLICAAIIINSFKNHAFSEIYPILFSAPLILTIFSYFILKEKVGPRRIIAVLIGFVGVLIVSRPGTVHFTFSLFLLFIGAIILAVNVLLIRMYANNQSSIAFAFYGFLAGLVLSGLYAYYVYIPLKENHIYILFMCGIIAGTGGLCISAASKSLESSLFAPLQYFQLIAGFIFGYLFFNDLPDIYEIFGSFIISLSGLFIIYREYKVGIRPFMSKETRFRDISNRGH